MEGRGERVILADGRELKEFWCQEKYDFCRPDGTNEAHQEVARMIMAEIMMGEEKFNKANYIME